MSCGGVETLSARRILGLKPIFFIGPLQHPTSGLNSGITIQNKSTQEHRYEGWATGIGISYGYTWILGKRWNLEANIGAGYIYTKYDKYECKTCGRFKGNQKKHYFGPTKAGISLIYIIK